MNEDTVFHEGVHLMFPWDIMYVYDIRIQSIDHEVEVLSTDGLEIRVTVTTRYFPVLKNLPQLHQKVGPDYMSRIVIPEVATAVREVMGQYRPEELYTRRSDEMEDEIRGRAARQVQDRYVTVDDVLIRRIALPESVQQAIQRKLTQEQEAQEYDFRLDKERKEAQRKDLEAGGIARYQEVVAGGIAAFQKAVANGNSEDFLRWKGIEATLELAKSSNAKVIIIGGREAPLILNESATVASPGVSVPLPGR